MESMEAEETAGLPMTERVARDCRSGLLQTTSNRPWSAAKMNTHQLLQSVREEGGRKGESWQEGRTRKGEREPRAGRDEVSSYGKHKRSMPHCSNQPDTAINPAAEAKAAQPPAHTPIRAGHLLSRAPD
ncbi:uncharacterized [Tachysurus ichikawai]